MRNITGLFIGGLLALFVSFFLAGVLSAPGGRFIMDGAPTWPWLVSLPVGIGIGYVVGKKVSRPRTK